MPVPALITNARMQAANVYNGIMTKGQLLVQGVVNQKNEIIQNWNNDLYPKHVKPLTEYYFTPLNKSDAYSLTAAGIVGVVSTLLPLSFGKSILPLTGLATWTALFGALALTHYRIHKYYNHLATQELTQIETQTTLITTVNKETQLPLIAAPFVQLNEKKYDHLKEDVKNLEKQHEIFKRAMEGRDQQTTKDQLIVQIDHLKGTFDQILEDVQQALDTPQISQADAERGRQTVQKVTGFLALNAAFKIEIEKVGTAQQNFREIEKKWLELEPIWNIEAVARMHQYLYNALRDLYKASEGPRFEEAKQTFIDKIKALKQKIS